MTKIGIALGSGGAKGLAHLPMLEALEELGLVPAMITGASMGSVIAGLYASGLSARDIRETLFSMKSGRGRMLRDLAERRDTVRFLDFIDIEISRGGVLKGDKVINWLIDQMRVDRFEDLTVPLRIVAADFWRREQVVLDSGELRSAIKASIALPLLFSPVERDGRVLIDGGTVNPVPYDLLPSDCDITIAIDVLGSRSRRRRRQNPSFFNILFNTFQVMQRAITDQKLRLYRPTLYVQPRIMDVRVLEFYKVERILTQAQPAKDRLKRDLSALLEQS